jgi:hypothetical protein
MKVLAIPFDLIYKQLIISIQFQNLIFILTFILPASILNLDNFPPLNYL